MTRIATDLMERIARSAHRFTDRISAKREEEHPFEKRNISTSLPKKVRDLFDDGHYSDASLTALKYLDKYVQRISGSVEIGKSLMMTAFSERGPLVRMGDLTNDTGRNQQEGFRFLAAGSVLFVRNPRAHEVTLPDSPDQCLDYLALTSMLLRELAAAGYR